MAALCRGFISLKAGLRSRKLNTPWLSSLCAKANGNQTHAAKLLDISRDALRYKLKKFGLIRGDEEASQTTVNEEQ